MVWNKYQSTPEQLNLDNYPEEIKEQFFDFINTVPYIKNLISENRPYAKDCPRDQEGKIIVDFTNPPIIEDTDYFRPTAIYFQKYGCITKLRPNRNPNSEYGKWIREEIRRCFYGYIRESDGAWITGDMYFFLNYCPIMKVKRIKGKKGLRVVDFPDFLEGQWLRFMYIQHARDNAKHGSELASRGKGKSYSMASIAAKRFLLGELDETTGEPTKGVETFISSYLKTYLNDDGVLNKFEKYIDFCAEYTQFPKKRLTSSLDKMKWTSGYKESNSEIKKGSGNEVIGISVKDSPGKLRGKRGAFIGLEEMGSFPNLIELYSTLRPSMEDGDIVFGMIYAQGCVCAGTKVLQENGKPINIEDVSINTKLLGYNGSNSSVEDITWLQPYGEKKCVRIITSKNNIIECSIDHPILALNKNRFNKSKSTCSFYRASEFRKGDTLLMPKQLGTFGNIHEKDAYLLGALFGDGSYSNNSCVTLSITTEEEYAYYNENYDINISKLKEGYTQIYFRGLHPLLKQYKMDKQAFGNKKLPYNIFDWDKESVCNFLGGYFNADGNIQIIKQKHRSIKLTCKYENTLQEIKYLLYKLGITSHIYKESKPSRILNSKVNNKCYKMSATDIYVLYISNSEDIHTFKQCIRFLIKRKQERLDSYNLHCSKHTYNSLKFELRSNHKGQNFIGKTFDNLQAVTIKSIENIGKQRIYNMTANTTHTYISNGFISSNTAGDKDSDFSAAQKIMYSPRAFNMQPIKNVYDKVGQGKPEFVYFYPAYINRNGCYNKDGISDITKAILEVLINRYNVKYNTTDATLITKTIAEHPIVPQEAVLRTRGNLFPSAQINERLNQIDTNPNIFDDVYVGELIFDKAGQVKYVPSDDIPIRVYPTEDNKERGAIEFYEMPQKNREGKVFPNRYIIGHDPKQLMGLIIVIL